MYIQIYQTRITQGLKDIEHGHYQTFVFLKKLHALRKKITQSNI